MLSKTELERFMTTLSFNIWQVERDYLQHLFLMLLGRHIGNELVFKGGTSLQKVYGLNRFSIDVDFTKNSDLDIELTFGKVVKDIINFGFVSRINFSKSSASETALVKINGPLYNGTEKTIATLRVDVSLRENIILPPQSKEIIPVYTDLSSYLVSVMRPEEILAEKIRAVLWRTNARDVYDLWFMLRKNVSVDLDLTNKKLNYYKIVFDIKNFKNKLEAIGKVWENDLKQIVTFVPDFDNIMDDILMKFKNLKT